MRFVTLDINNRAHYFREGKTKLEHEIQSDTAKRGQLYVNDEFVDDPIWIAEQAEIEACNLANKNKQEAYVEYLELEKMLGAESPEALAAKNAYLTISAEAPGKCRYELETELEAEKEQGATLLYELSKEKGWV